MGLRELELSSFYRSPSDSINTTFYVPCLKESKLFYRAAGFFSLSGLCDHFDGVIDVLKRKGEIRIITSPNLSENELQILKGAYDKEKVIAEKLLKDIDDNIDYVFDEKLELLSSLIVNDAIKIKIVYKEVGLYHEKYGFFTDDNDDSVWFIGSGNLSIAAHSENTELMYSGNSWNSKKDFEDVKNLFFDEWIGNSSDSCTIDLPVAVKNRLIGNYEKTDVETAIKKYEKKVFEKLNVKKLYPHQEKAVDYFFNNNSHGFLEMATGTGKTYTSCKIIEKSIELTKPFVLVLVPQMDLQDQWDTELKKLGINTYLIGGIGSGGDKAKADFLDAKADFLMQEPSVCIITYSTYFEKLAEEIKGFEENTLIVIDEAHNISENQFKLLPNVKYRLGLSATPIKHDLELSKKIVEYFTDGIDSYKYTIEDAINNDFLSRYNYYPIFVELNDDFTEFDDFCKLSAQIAALLSNKPLDKETKEKINKKANDRSLIVKKAVNKKIKLEEMLNDDKYIFKNAVIYCGAGKDNDPSEDNSLINNITSLLYEYRINCNQFTSMTPDRKSVLDLFKKGFYDVLVAMRCFDEGVDVPQLERIYIMSSERLVRQTVQRRGRVLRKCKESGKTIGYIYDFVAMPPNSGKDKSGARSLIKLEFSRVHEYMRLSENKDIDGYAIMIKQIENEYGLEWDEEERRYGREEFEDIDEEE